MTSDLELRHKEIWKSGYLSDYAPYLSPDELAHWGAEPYDACMLTTYTNMAGNVQFVVKLPVKDLASYIFTDRERAEAYIHAACRAAYTLHSEAIQRREHISLLFLIDKGEDPFWAYDAERLDQAWCNLTMPVLAGVANQLAFK